jgi:hypothetical protein
MKIRPTIVRVPMDQQVHDAIRESQRAARACGLHDVVLS